MEVQADESGNVVDTSKQTISGTVTLPGYTPAGSLWIVVDGLDGNIYGSGVSNPDGTFSIETSPPPDNGDVLLYAVDPDNPESGAMVYVSLEENISGKAVNESNEATNLVSVNARSTAEVYVSMVTGLTPPEFSPEDVAMVNKIADEFLIDPPNLCAVDKTPLNAFDKDLYEQFLEQAGKSRSVVGEYIDEYVNETGSLIYRVKRAQIDISKNVTSLNQADGWRIDEGTVVATTIGLVRTRTMLEFVLGDGIFGGLTKESISLEDLDNAAGVIIGVFGKNGLTGGIGNCMEKGIAGTFIASRFKEFKQVAFVAVESPQFVTSAHAFAIACQKDENTWDLKDIMAKHSANTPIPNGLFDAECMVIDPWLGITKELTPDTVKDLKWQEYEFVHVMSVDSAVSNQSNINSFYNAFNLKAAASAPVVCPIDPEPTPKLCTPFSIPGSPNTPPEADSQSVTTDENTSKVIALTGSDLDWDPLTYIVVSQPSHGSLSGTAPDLVYMPDTGYSGPDSFTFKVNDGSADSAAATVTITVNGPVREYVLWYTDNVRCWGAPFLYISEREQVNETGYRCNYQGGGIDCTQELVKTEIQGGFSTWEDASNWICPKITGAHYSHWCGGSRAHWIVSGQTLDFRLGNLGCDLADVPDVPIPDPHPGM